MFSNQHWYIKNTVQKYSQIEFGNAPVSNFVLNRHFCSDWISSLVNEQNLLFQGYRRPSLFAVLVSAVSTFRRLFFDARFCYPRTFPLIIRGFCNENKKKGKIYPIFRHLIEYWCRYCNYSNVKLFQTFKLLDFMMVKISLVMSSFGIRRICRT